MRSCKPWHSLVLGAANAFDTDLRADIRGGLAGERDLSGNIDAMNPLGIL